MTASDSPPSFRIPVLSGIWSGIRRSWKNLRNTYKRSFFIRRRPKWNISKEWVRPDDATYRQELFWQGFITVEYWSDDDLSEYPLIMQDLDDLEEYLLPVFWEFNQKSKYYQNNFYKYQWIFTLGAFFTTILAVLTGYYGGLPEGDARFFLIVLEQNTLVNIFGSATTVISAITTYYTVLSNQGEPRKRWASYRRLAEELRMIYFLYVSRMAPYERANRIDVLRRRVLELRRQEKENG